MEKMKNVYIMDHPLIKHKISMLRDKNTGTNEFRKLVEEIGILMSCVRRSTIRQKNTRYL